MVQATTKSTGMAKSAADGPPVLSDPFPSSPDGPLLDMDPARLMGEVDSPTDELNSHKTKPKPKPMDKVVSPTVLSASASNPKSRSKPSSSRTKGKIHTKPVQPEQPSPTMENHPATSREWDAAQVPPSQFQRRKGSIFATPNSRDSQRGSDRDRAYHQKLKEKGWTAR